MNHTGSISHHIMPLVINVLGDRQTDTHTHTDAVDKSNIKKSGMAIYISSTDGSDSHKLSTVTFTDNCLAKFVKIKL